MSAAALMLGVSQAATVGFNFQANYCGNASYSGAVVTAQAFGVNPNGWESLTTMDTGYGCTPGYYTLNQTIDTTSSACGLNPLPNGSLAVTWSAYSANCSGFGGYDRSGPSYSFGGNGHTPGNEEVYWGFLRDGVNFGFGSSGGDNNQPGYSIDITGLKSFFTNTPFAVQLIASADSMQYLTNAFIIDATASTTQSVVYPSTPPVSDVGDTAWIRGIGGGLSTASGSFNTDHLQIIGNRAAHGGDKVTGYNFASTISGFIITDKPVISMSPHQAVVCLGDTVVWSAYAVGVPPLSYQWRKNGEPIPGATTLAYGVTNVTMANSGTYDLVVTNIYGTAMSSPVTMDRLSTSPAKNLVQDLNPMGPEHSGLNNWATWLASSTDGKSVTRTGVMSFSATATNSVTNYSVVVTSCVVTNQVVSTNIGNQITVPGQTDFNSSTGTIMFWMRSSGVANPAGSPATLFDRLNKVSNGDGCVIVQDTDGTIEFQGQSSANGLVVDVQTGNPIADNNWHHVAVVYDQSSGGTSAIYIDGNLDSSSPGNSLGLAIRAGA